MFHPSVIEKIGRSSKSYDLPTKMLQNRIVYLGSEIDEDVANSVIMQLLWLNSDNEDKPITLFINSPGGSVYDGLAIKDIMYTLKCKVNTTGAGRCSSMGAYLLASGTGERKATKNCKIMLHSVSAGTAGSIHDMKIDFEEFKTLEEKMLVDTEEFTKGKSSIEYLREKTERDWIISPEKAIEIGIIDSIL